MGKEVHRQEHYHEWLTMQNVSDSMRDSDIKAIGYSNIPSHDKWAAYSGYPRSNDSGNHDQNATPGPSHLYIRRHENDDHDCDHDHNNSCTNMTIQYKRWQGNDPDNQDDSLSLDGTYRPSYSSLSAHIWQWLRCCIEFWVNHNLCCTVSSNVAYMCSPIL